MSLVTEFVNHELRERGSGLSDESICELRGRDSLKKFLALIYGDTLGLTEPKALIPAFERYSLIFFINFYWNKIIQISDKLQLGKT